MKFRKNRSVWTCLDVKGSFDVKVLILDLLKVFACNRLYRALVDEL